MDQLVGNNEQNVEELNEVIDDMNEENNEEMNETIETTDKKAKKVLKKSDKKVSKRGIVYLSHVPLGLNPNKIRQLLAEFGEIDRIYLEKEKSIKDQKKSRKNANKKSYNCRYVEGWVEFKKKRIAKTVANVLNAKQIGGKRRNQCYDSIWSLKYLHKFKWSHLAEQLNYEKALRQQRLRLEISRAKTETAFYEQMSNKFNYNKHKKGLESDKQSTETRSYKQRVTDEVIRKKKPNSDDVDLELLSQIFK